MPVRVPHGHPGGLLQGGRRPLGPCLADVAICSSRRTSGRSPTASVRRSPRRSASRAASASRSSSTATSSARWTSSPPRHARADRQPPRRAPLASVSSSRRRCSAWFDQERERQAAQELRESGRQHARRARGRCMRRPHRSGDGGGRRRRRPDGWALSKLLGDLRGSVSSIATNSEALAAAAEELQVVSEQMGANSAETSSQVNLVTEASIEVSRNVETVSTGAEEMSASIKEIAKNASDAAKVATPGGARRRRQRTTRSPSSARARPRSARSSR